MDARNGRIWVVVDGENGCEDCWRVVRQYRPDLGILDPGDAFELEKQVFEKIRTCPHDPPASARSIVFPLQLEISRGEMMNWTLLDAPELDGLDTHSDQALCLATEALAGAITRVTGVECQPCRYEWGERFDPPEALGDQVERLMPEILDAAARELARTLREYGLIDET